MAMLNILNNNYACLNRLAHHEEVVLGRGSSMARTQAAELLAQVTMAAGATEGSVRDAIRSAVGRVRSKGLFLAGILDPSKRPRFVEKPRFPGETFPVLGVY